MASCVTVLPLFMGILMQLFASSSLVSAANVDFLYLVLMWPGAYCSQSACCRPTTGMPAEDFFIRGLWTYNEAGKPVTRCTREPYNPTEMEGLEPELYEYWSSIKCPSNDGSLYWKKAWKTYGTCTGMYQPTYFETALDLRAHVDLLTAFANKGITASETRKYSIESIEKAIEEATKARPVIRCNKEGQLYEIYVCFDKHGGSAIECPVRPYFSCPDEIIIPPFTDNMLKIHAYPSINATPSVSFQ